jgi:hypothetical protein
MCTKASARDYGRNLTRTGESGRLDRDHVPTSKASRPFTLSSAVMAKEQDLFRWSISRRNTPLGVKLTGGGFHSHHAARAAGSKVLEELVENILREEKNAT